MNSTQGLGINSHPFLQTRVSLEMMLADLTGRGHTYLIEGVLPGVNTEWLSGRSIFLLQKAFMK